MRCCSALALVALALPARHGFSMGMTFTRSTIQRQPAITLSAIEPKPTMDAIKQSVGALAAALLISLPSLPATAALDAPVVVAQQQSKAQPSRKYINLTGFPFPLGPFTERRTVATELVPGKVYGFEQEQKLSGITANVRSVVFRMRDNHLLVYNPVAPTDEFLRQLDALDHAGISHIMLGATTYEHKIFVGPFARKFPAAQVWAVPDQWSFPIDLPAPALGISTGGGRPGVPSSGGGLLLDTASSAAAANYAKAPDLMDEVCAALVFKELLASPARTPEPLSWCSHRHHRHFSSPPPPLVAYLFSHLTCSRPTCPLSRARSLSLALSQFEVKLLRPKQRLGFGYAANEAAVLHKDSKTLALTDALVNVPATAPAIYDPASLMAVGDNTRDSNSLGNIILKAAGAVNWRGTAKAEVESLWSASAADQQQAEEAEAAQMQRGWERNTLLSLYFGPSPRSLVDPDASFQKLSSKWVVAPVTDKLIYSSSRVKPELSRWVEDVARWDFQTIAPAHFDVRPGTPADLKAAFAPTLAEAPPGTPANADAPSLPYDRGDASLLDDLASGLVKVGII